MNDPILYTSIYLFDFIKIINAVFSKRLDIKQVLMDRSIIRCNGKMDIVYSKISNIRAFRANKDSIKQLLENWYTANGTLYLRYPGYIQENIIGLIYVMDLIHNSEILDHLLLSISMCVESEFSDRTQFTITF